VKKHRRNRSKDSLDRLHLQDNNKDTSKKRFLLASDVHKKYLSANGNHKISFNNEDKFTVYAILKDN